ncbi:MAG TPA: hypothetical protein P5315_10885 [Clostridia bacterium]|nr:hypothetical protein [Clostridia bacterium]
MVKTTAILVEELNEYVNPAAKIRRMVNDGRLIPVIRGIYETDRNIPGHYLAPVIYGPSYLSFEFALAYYSLIPEAVYVYTSATFRKRRTKRYKTPFGMYTYRDIPDEAYPVGVVPSYENGYGFFIASPEKAICDELYKISPLGNRKELEEMLFGNLRINEDDFHGLDLDDLHGIASYYHTQNHRLLQSYLKGRI